MTEQTPEKVADLIGREVNLEDEIARALAEYLVTDFEHGPFSDTAFVRAEVEADGMVSLFTSESAAAWPAASFDAPQLAEWIVRSPLLNRVRAEALREAAGGVNLHRFVPDGRDDLAYLCEDDDCLWWDMTYALRDELNDHADRIEQNSEGNET